MVRWIPRIDEQIWGETCLEFDGGYTVWFGEVDDAFHGGATPIDGVLGVTILSCEAEAYSPAFGGLYKVPRRSCLDTIQGETLLVGLRFCCIGRSPGIRGKQIPR